MDGLRLALRMLLVGVWERGRPIWRGNTQTNFLPAVSFGSLYWASVSIGRITWSFSG